MTPPTSVAFAIGTGRCGTHLLARLLAREARVAASHERNPLNETFHRYCKWYGLPVDDAGFLHAKAREIQTDLRRHAVSFEASAHLALSVRELYRRFDAKFILLVRNPEGVVNSYLRKGWYADALVRAEPSLAPGYQANRHFHHFLGRVVPSGPEFTRWSALTRVGQLAWFWRALNARVLEQFAELPPIHWRLQRLEDLSYEAYRDLVRFLGLESRVSARRFEAVARRRPGHAWFLPSVARWGPVERAEFEREIQPVAGQLGYAGRLAVPPAVVGPPGWRARLHTLLRPRG